MEQARNLKDAALGCLLGACVGDAAGATLEFMAHPPTNAEVQRALQMPGGGVWQVAPGQITDDCELGLSLARALAASPHFDLERIAQAYRDWILSNPFDIGTTTIRSLGSFQTAPWRALCEQEGCATGMTQAAAQLCMESKSNGSLMRAAALGVWGRNLSEADLAACARHDSCLSHPNPSCWQAVACYTLAIAHLMNHGGDRSGDRAGAFQRAQTWATTHANEEVRSWLADAKQGVNVAYTPLIGFVRIGFTHAFRHLLLGTNFVDAIAETLAGGGDTDTNACIVGGLIGAAAGARAIPDYMSEPVLNCNTALGQARPDFLHPRHLSAMVEAFVAIR